MALPAHHPPSVLDGRPACPSSSQPPAVTAPARSRRPRSHAPAPRLIAVLAVLAVWAAARGADLASTLVLPSPWAVQETVRSYRIPRLLRFGKVVLPAALPSIMTGLRLAATTSVLVCVGVEILSSVHGIGARITALQVDGASNGTYAYILVCGVLGFAITRVSELAEDRVLRWRPPAEDD